MTTPPTTPPPENRIAPVLRTLGHGIARSADAVRRGVDALNVPTRLADARDDLRALDLDVRAAALARKSGSAARRAAGLARVHARRAADAGAARLAAHTRPAPAHAADPMARPVTRAAPVPIFAADGAAAPIAPPTAPPPATAQIMPVRWLEDRKTQMTIAIGSLAITGLAAALAAAPPAAAPTPAPGSAAFGEAVRAYILDHPEIIPEAVAKLQQRETGKLLTDNRAALETPFSGAWAGAADGDVVLVEFTDYACGFCRASVRDIDRLLAEDRKLKIVYREIPILGPGSEQAAQIALSAARQGRHAAVHRGLFAAGAPSTAKSASVATQARLDPAATARAATDPVIAKEIADNLALARGIGLTGTPTFIIGNRILSGAVGYDTLKDAVAEARSGA